MVKLRCVNTREEGKGRISGFHPGVDKNECCVKPCDYDVGYLIIKRLIGDSPPIVIEDEANNRDRSELLRP